MNELPTIELLESMHEFPVVYMFKAIGKADRGFVARAVAAVLGPGLAPARDGVGPFLADVRDGMDEYLDRHAPRTGPTLDSQPAARPPLASPPDPPRGRPQRGRSLFNHAKDGR